MSTISEALATPHEFEHKGKKYTINLITQGVKSKFEKALFTKAKNSLKELRDAMDKDEYMAELKALGWAYESGEFTLESARGQQILQTVPGMLLMMGLLIPDVSENELIGLLAERGEDLNQLLLVVFRDSYPGVGNPTVPDNTEPDPEAKKN